MQKYLFLLSAIFFLFSAQAQEELDSNGQKDDARLRDLIWVKDTAFGVIKSKRFSNLKILYPSFKLYRRFIDTSEAGAQSDITQFAMYNNFWNRLRLQFNKLHKKAWKAGIEWEQMKLDSFHIDSGGKDNEDYAYIRWIARFNGKKRYVFSALFLNIRGRWFLMDELKYEGLLPEKKKRKPVRAKD